MKHNSDDDHFIDARIGDCFNLNDDNNQDNFFMSILTPYQKPTKLKMIKQSQAIQIFEVSFNQTTDKYLLIAKQILDHSNKIDLIKKSYFQYKANHGAILRPIKLSISPRNQFESYYIYPENGLLSNFIGFSFDDNFQKVDTLSPTQKTIIAFGVADAMRVLHQQGYMHGKISASNIFLDSKFHPYLSNFYKIVDVYSKAKKKFKTEKFNKFEKTFCESSLKFDIYSYSIVYAALIEPITFEQPIHSANELFQRLAEKDRPVCKKASKEQREVLELMWDYVPRDRINANQVIEQFENGKLVFPGTDMDEFEEYKRSIKALNLTSSLYLKKESDIKNITDANLTKKDHKIGEKNDDETKNKYFEKTVLIHSSFVDCEKNEDNEIARKNEAIKTTKNEEEDNEIENVEEKHKVNEIEKVEEIDRDNEAKSDEVVENEDIETKSNEKIEEDKNEDSESIDDDETESNEETEKEDNYSESIENEEEEEDNYSDSENEEEDTTDYSNIPIVNLKDYKVIKKLGEGNFGTVQLVKNIKTDKLYAAKIAKDEILSRKEKKQFYREIKTQVQASCPSVLKLIGISMKNFEGEDYPTIITEYKMNKSLKDNLNDESRSIASAGFTPTKKYIILLGIALGMKYLHFQGIIHRDLKPDNILLDEDFYPYICDFGFSEMSDFQFFVFENKFHLNCGTPLYMAPEILENSSYTYKVDVYSFSLIAYEVLTGKYPFEKGMNICQLIKIVTAGKHPDLSIITDDKISEFLSKCWSGNPTLRPTFDDIVEELLQERYIEYFNADRNEVDNYLELFDENIKTHNSNSDIALNVKKLADGGDARSMYNYGYLLINGDSIKQNIEEGVHYIKLAADKGFEPALARYGVFCVVGFGVPRNEEEAVPYLKKSAELRSTYGMTMYGGMLLEGKTVPLNKKKGEKYLKISADRGNVKSIYHYANELYNGDKIDQNYEKALMYYKKGADLGDDNSLCMYAYMIQNGLGIKENKEMAAKLYQEAADNDHVKSKYLLGMMHMNGEIKDANKTMASLYFFQASEKGYADAYFALGLLSYEGEGLIPSKKQAASYYMEASKLGSNKAMYNLALMFEKGDGIEKDIDKALQYYSLAVKHGNSNALIRLGVSLIKGEFGTKDEKKGFEYLKVSIENGNQDAVKIYKDLLKEVEEEKDNMKKGIENGDPEAMFNYALKLFRGDDVDKNVEESLKYFKIAGDKGHLKSLFNYGYIIFKGNGVPCDKENGLKYMKIAADHDCLEANETLGSIFFSGVDIPYDLNEAAFYLKKAVDLGSSRASHLYIVILSLSDTLDDEENAYYVEKARETEVDEITKNIIQVFMYMRSNENVTKIKELCDQGDMKTITELVDHIKSGNKKILNDEDTAKYLLKAIEAGNSDAMYLYGKMLYNGEGMEVNKEEAVRYYKMSADEGNEEGMLLYGKMLFEGEGIEKNEEEAATYFLPCAKEGNAEAQFLIGKFFYFKSKKEDEDEDNKELYKLKAEIFLKMSADEKNTDAMYLYAVMQYEKDDLLCTLEGNEYLVSSAKEGNADANLLLGKRNMNSKNPEIHWRIVQYFKIAADKGNAEAMFLYANKVNEGDGIEKNQKEAKKYFKMAIDSGYKEAIIKYGEILADDISIPKTDEDLFYLKITADSGNDKALLKYAKYLYRKINEIEEKEEIVRYVKMALDKTDDVEMILYYAKMLHDGLGVEENKKEAARYYEMAASKDKYKGSFEFAEILYNGDGVDVDKKKAFEFYKIAADEGNSEAMKKMGDMLTYGDGIDINRTEGQKYHQKAIENEKSLRQNMEMASGIASYFGIDGFLEALLS